MSINYPGEAQGFCVGYVVGGDSEDPAKDEAGGMRVRKATHGPNVPHTDLPFSRKLGVGSEEAMISNSPPLERGTAVLCIEPPGRSTTGDVIVLGALTNERNKGGTTPGNFPLSQLFEDAVNHVTNKKSAPKSLQKDSRDGAEIRKVVDDKMWSHALAKGLPSGLGLWPLSGIHLDQVKNVPTAIQSFSALPSISMLGNLPGMSMSLGSMLSLLKSSGALDRIRSALPSEAQTAFDSMSNLITTVETSSGSAFGTASRVNPDVYLNNAEQMLSQCRDISDMVHCFKELQSNTELFGLDTLEEVTVEQVTPFGTIDYKIDANGSTKETVDMNVIITLAGAEANSNTANANLSNAIAKTVASQPKQSSKDTVQSILQFAGMLQSAAQAFSISGEAFFGKSAVRHFDMLQRLNTTSGEIEKKMMQVLHQGTKETNNLLKQRKIVRDGGNPLARSSGFS